MYQTKMRRDLLLLCAIASAVAVTGCGDATNTLDTEYVEGVVTLDGEPVADATVTFVPVEEGQGAPATGMTDQQGVYTLTAAVTGEVSATHGAGTLPGEYYVGVTKMIVETPMSEEEAEKMGVEYISPATDTPPSITHVVPERYNSPRQSGIRVAVQAGSNDIPIELTSD
jgi:hypothetical protein